MQDDTADEVRHFQRSTPTLRTLLPITSVCRQLRFEFAETLSKLRSKTVHHFRILDIEDFCAFQGFFNNTNMLHYRLTPQLTITIPLSSAKLPAVFATFVRLPESPLESLTLELPMLVPRNEGSPELFLQELDHCKQILQLGPMVCTKLSYRRFDGMRSFVSRVGT